MKTLLIFLGLIAAAVPAARAKTPADHFFGVRPGMTFAGAHRVLRATGAFCSADFSDDSGETEREDEGREYWILSDPRYAHLVVSYTRDRTVLWMTAFARPGAPPIPYKSIGDLSKAVSTGYYFFTWDVATTVENAGYRVLARGNHPKNLSSITLVTRGGE